MQVLKECDIDEMHIRVFQTRREMGMCAGKDVADRMRTLLAEKEEINVMFAAAPSQNETLETLVEEDGIDWSRVNAFHMDEYVGLPESHPAGFRNYLKRSIFDKKPFRSIHLLNGNAADPEKEAEAYEALLKDNALDICLLGVGENGHIAFNDPHVADFDDPKLVKVVHLDERCRKQQVNDGCFAEIDEVPKVALSVTIPGLCGASYMFCSVPSKHKAEAVEHLTRDAISTACPATILRRQKCAMLYTDAEAGKSLLG